MSDFQRLHWEALKLKSPQTWILFIEMDKPVLSATFNDADRSLEVRCLNSTYEARDLPQEIQARIREGNFSLTVKSDSTKSFYDFPVKLRAH